MRNPFTLVRRLATRAPKPERARPPKPAQDTPTAHPTPPKAAPAPIRASRLGDLAVLWVAIIVTVAVGAAAGFISFRHFVSLARTLGEPFEQAVLYPAAAEGLVVMAGLVMLYCSRRDLRVPILAWVSMGFGILVALSVNVVHGYARSVGAAALAALAPIAFVASYELLMRLIRLVRLAAAVTPFEEHEEHVCPEPDRAEVRVMVPMQRLVKVTVPVEHRVEIPTERIVEKRVEVPVPFEQRVEVPTPVVPVDALDAARIAYEHSLNGPGRALGQRALARRFGLELRVAEEIIKSSQEALGHTAPQAAEQAPAVTLQEAAEQLAQDRHSAPAEETTDEPAEQPAAKPAVTIIWPDPEPAQDRHSTSDDEPAEPSPASDENTPSPAPVTITDAHETTADDRHSNAAEESPEPVSEDALNEPPVTVPAAPVEAPAVPSQRIPLTSLAAIFREPDDEPPVHALNGANGTVTDTGWDDLS